MPENACDAAESYCILTSPAIKRRIRLAAKRWKKPAAARTLRGEWRSTHRITFHEKIPIIIDDSNDVPDTYRTETSRWDVMLLPVTDSWSPILQGEAFTREEWEADQRASWTTIRFPASDEHWRWLGFQQPNNSLGQLIITKV